MPMYHLTHCIDNYLKESGILWQYCRDEPILAADHTITDKTGNDDTEKVNIMLPLKYLYKF